MSVVEADITDAFGTALIAAVEMCGEPLEIKFPNMTFVADNSGKYFELVQIRNNMTNETWGDEKTYRGMFRVMLHYPKSDQGAIPATRLLSNIAEIIPKGSRLQSGQARITIVDAPDIGDDIGSETEMILPLTFHYQDFQHA